MKLLSKQDEGEKVRRVYDPAKTPLQRLLLSGILPTAIHHHLREVAQALDPLSLLHQLEHLQQALWRCAVNMFPLPPRTPSASIVPFCVERCLPGALPPEKRVPAPASVLQRLQDKPQSETGLLDWPRTMRDPFEGEWELILSLVLTHPEWSGGELFQELQRLFPERYHSSQLSTIQHGLRKIRARWLEIVEEPWPQEVIQACVLPSYEPHSDRQETEPPRDLLSSPSAVLLPPQVEASEERDQLMVKEEASPPQVPAIPIANEDRLQLSEEGSQHAQGLQIRRLTMTIEEAIQAYLQEQMDAGRRRKTLEWHQTALGLLQQYLVDERHLGFLNQITEGEVRGWVAFLRTTSSVTGTPRRASTIATYGRSVRAFCHWAVRKGYLERTPLARGILPKAGKKRIQVIEPAGFDHLRLSCRPGGDSSASMDRVAARNRSILWVLMDTGMRVSELCGLRLWDVDREQRTLRVQGRGNERWLALSPNGWFQLLSYLEQHRPKEVFLEGRQAEEAPLFLSETYQPLTINALTLLFDRLRKRAGMTEERVNPSLLRDTFAVRYLQAGGEPEALCTILGLTGMASLKRYEQLCTQKIEHEPQKEPTEEHRPKAMAVPQKSIQRRRKSSSAAMRKQRRKAGRPDDSARKETVTSEEDDPLKAHGHIW